MRINKSYIRKTENTAQDERNHIKVTATSGPSGPIDVYPNYLIL